jgi:hypothetical protein
VLNDAKVTEHVLIWHLNAEGPLTANTSHSGWHVHCPYVPQSAQADVNCDESTWKGINANEC